MRAANLVTANPSTIATFRSMLLFCLGQVMKVLVEWPNRGVSRRELSALSEQQVWDIGITRGTAKYEAGKHFWRR